MCLGFSARRRTARSRAEHDHGDVGLPGGGVRRAVADLPQQIKGAARRVKLSQHHQPWRLSARQPLGVVGTQGERRRVVVGDQLVNDGAAEVAVGLYDENLTASGLPKVCVGRQASVGDIWHVSYTQS